MDLRERAAYTATSDAWTLSSHTVNDQSGQVEAGTQSKSGFAVAGPRFHVTAVTGTQEDGSGNNQAHMNLSVHLYFTPIE